MMKASGKFEIQFEKRETSLTGEMDFLFSNTAFTKKYSGDLEGLSQGEMLSVRTPIEGSASYVALETVKGRLTGRSGSFVLQHNGEMRRGEQALSILVVPDSGTGGLAGLTGSMQIRMEDGKHYYEFDYEAPD